MILKAEQLEIGYPSRTLIKPFNLTLKPGGLHFIIGRNGAGKSTLLRTLAGMQKPIAGQVSIDGDEIFAMTVRDRASLMYYLSGRQGTRSRISVEEFLRIGVEEGVFSRRRRIEWRSKLKRVAEEIGISDLLLSSIQRLSDGEFQKMMIALVLLRNAKVLLLDEPLSHLDPPSREDMLVLFSRLALDRVVLISSHQLTAVYEYAAEVFLLNSDQMLQVVPKSELRRSKDIITMYR